MKHYKKLSLWQDRLAQNALAYSDEEARMDARERLYLGENRSIAPLTAKDGDGQPRRAVHIRNIIAENIESQVNSNIPQPKVTARRKSDEWRAKLLEDMLRNELDRLPFEQMNDLMERTIPIQGGALWLIEWDNARRTHDTVGEVVVSTIHPKQAVPQDGVYTGVADMDYIILKLPQTKEYIKRKYGVDVALEGESEPEVKTATDGGEYADEMVTQYIAYYRNDEGGIGLYSWVNDVELEDLEDYQARRLRKCTVCGAVASALDESCPACGGKKFKESIEEFEEVFQPITTPNGVTIPGAQLGMDPETGLPKLLPTKLPYYKPAAFPVVLQKNISVFGRFLGDSDVDKIADQQNTLNRMETKVIDRLIKAGTRITLPDRADIRVDPEDGEKWYIGNVQDKQLIDIYQFSGDLQFEMAYLAQVYEEARQMLGITDSFQGRRDTTANSGVAKQFSAAQSAGRLESKRVLKEAAYADIFKLIAQFKVAYADETRPVVASDDRGNARYGEFSRYDFYEQGADGEWYCVLEGDRFLFSCDTSAPLANNREAMWEAATAHLQSGAYGDPADIDTLIMYWAKLELLHYPGASDTKAYLEERKKAMAMARQAAQADMDRMMQQAQEMDAARPRDAQTAAQQMVQVTSGGNPGGDNPTGKEAAL